METIKTYNIIKGGEKMTTIFSKFSLAAVATAMLLSSWFSTPVAAANMESINLGISLDTTYQYSSNGTVGRGIDGRGLYPEHNEFSIDAFILSLEKEASLGGDPMDSVGFRADVLFGEQAERLGFGFNTDGDGSVSPYQAYLNVMLPLADNGLNVQVGQFVTLAGWEVIEGRNNTNITRSFLFYRIPFAHSGIRGSFSAGMVDLAFGLSNDWDAVDDVDDGKTFEAQAAVNFPNDGWLGITGYIGETDSELRTLVTVVGTVTLMDKYTFVGDLEYTSHDAGGNRWGFAGYATTSFTDSLGLSIRGEYVDDEEIIINEDGTTAGVKLYGFTSTLMFTPFAATDGNFETRLEYRYDRAGGDDHYFSGDKQQHGVAVQLLYWLDV